MQKDKSIRDSDIDDTIRFFANTLHEIRTPIQTIIGSAELMQGTKLDKEQTEYIRQIMFSAEGLLELANDILDLAKIHQSELKLESIPFDITELTEHVIDLISIDAFGKGLEVITDIDYSMQRTIMGDPTRVQQILLNLVGNAVKFTDAGLVEWSAEAHEDGEGTVSLNIDVTDTGTGIAKEKLKTTSAVVLVVIVFFAVYLSIIGNGGRWLLEKVGFYQQVEPTETAETLADSGLSLSDDSGEA